MRSFEAVERTARRWSESMAVRTTRITIETESLFVVRQGRTVVAWCPGCQADVEVMLLAEDSSVAQLLGALPAGTLHVWSPPEGPVQVCLTSLLQRSQSDEVQLIPERTLPNKGEGQ